MIHHDDKEISLNSSLLSSVLVSNSILENQKPEDIFPQESQGNFEQHHSTKPKEAKRNPKNNI